VCSWGLLSQMEESWLFHFCCGQMAFATVALSGIQSFLFYRLFYHVFLTWVFLIVYPISPGKDDDLVSTFGVRTILGEYAGAVLGALSTLLFSRNGLVWRRVGGLLAMCAAYYFLSQGWAMSSYSPFYILLLRTWFRRCYPGEVLFFLEWSFS
jgi:hypothetical protein